MRLITYIIFISLFVSCVKDKPNPVTQNPVSMGAGHKVYICNEGNFGSSNSSVSLFDLENNSVVSDLYKTQNNNAVLGDVCQSILKLNNRFYIVVNNSGKIVVVNADDFKFETAITGLNSPRYVLPVSPNKAYVSDLYANSVSIIDLNTQTKTGSIACGGWTEQMALIYNKAFVTNMNRDYCYVVNTINDQITDSILTGPNAGSIVIDKNSKVWILSSGKTSSNTLAKLTRINPVTMQTEITYTFNTGDAPNNLCMNAAKDKLYFLKGNVYSMNITDATLPSTYIINGNGHTFYGLSINPLNNDIYVSDAIDYVQKSSVMIYSSKAQLKQSFKAGINASYFWFD